MRAFVQRSVGGEESAKGSVGLGAVIRDQLELFEALGFNRGPQTKHIPGLGGS